MIKNKAGQTKKMYMGVYGCQMNLSDAERMEGLLRTIGYEKTTAMEEADLILLNTCCVRESAEDKVYGKIGEIKHLKKEKAGLIFGIAGCMAQKEGNRLIKRAPHIDFVLGTNKFNQLIPAIMELEAKRARHVVDIDWTEAQMPEGLPVVREGRLSAWIPIMFGCDNFCTYCIVPYVRGRERSRRPEDIINEIRQATAEGFREITLLGQNVNSYGKDHQQADFPDLLKMADEIEGIARIRYMTSHPKDLSHKLIETVRDSRHICEHFHVPVQYGSDKILKAMNRGYSLARYRELVRDIRETVPGASLTTDLIVGFPGETEAQAANTRALLQECAVSFLHVFPYSRRPGTPAAGMPDQVSAGSKSERAGLLRKLDADLRRHFYAAHLGRVLRILVERRRADGMLEGFSENYIPVRLAGPEALVGKIAAVRLLRVDAGGPFGILETGA